MFRRLCRAFSAYSLFHFFPGLAPRAHLLDPFGVNWMIGYALIGSVK
jgi:hypothetical protein